MVFRRRDRPPFLTRVRELVYPRTGWKRAIEYIGHRIRRIPDTPHRIALGFACGVMASFNPLFGLHFVIAVALAWAVRGNLLAAMVGTFVGNPLTFPLIASVSLPLGRRILGHGASGRDFTRTVLQWALPASLALAAAAITVQLLTEGLLGQSTNEARTLVSLTMGLTGLFFMVEVLGFHGASWRSLTRPVMTTLLGALLVAGFLLTVYTPALRDFFDFTEVHTADWVIVGCGVAGALAGQYLLSRYWQEFLDLITAAPKKTEALRGRAV